MLLGNNSASGDHFGALFAFWDMIYNIHPMFMNCRQWMYGMADNVVLLFDEINDIRRIIVNIVNHIDELTDAILDLTHFFGSTEKGHDLDGPYRVGQSIGSLIYFSIAAENDVPSYDPADEYELGDLPW